MRAVVNRGGIPKNPLPEVNIKSIPGYNPNGESLSSVWPWKVTLRHHPRKSYMNLSIQGPDLRNSCIIINPRHYPNWKMPQRFAFQLHPSIQETILHSDVRVAMAYLVRDGIEVPPFLRQSRPNYRRLRCQQPLKILIPQPVGNFGKTEVWEVSCTIALGGSVNVKLSYKTFETNLCIKNLRS